MGKMHYHGNIFIPGFSPVPKALNWARKAFSEDGLIKDDKQATEEPRAFVAELEMQVKKCCANCNKLSGKKNKLMGCVRWVYISSSSKKIWILQYLMSISPTMTIWKGVRLHGTVAKSVKLNIGKQVTKLIALSQRRRLTLEIPFTWHCDQRYSTVQKTKLIVLLRELAI